MKTMKFKAAIYDLDGVIVDTVPLHFKAWQRMFSEYGKEFSFDDYKQKVDGIPRVDGCRAILTDASDDIIKAACDKKQGYYLEYLESEGVKVYDTTISLIKELRTNGIKTAVISSSKNCPKILDSAGITDLFFVQINGNDITKGKPDPQIFLMAAERLGINPDGCVVFEDATLGVEAAKRAGMLCVGIDRNNKPHLFTKADLAVTDLGEVDFNRLQSLFT
jgi:beta-phosphoglucomutase